MVGQQRRRVLALRQQVEQGGEARGRERPGVGNRREPAAREALDRGDHAVGCRAGVLAVGDRRELQAVVAAAAPAGELAGLGRLRDQAPGREGDRVLVERPLGVLRDPGGAERQPTAEGAAEVVALRQLVRVRGQQLGRARQKPQRQGARLGSRRQCARHKRKYTYASR